MVPDRASRKAQHQGSSRNMWQDQVHTRQARAAPFSSSTFRLTLNQSMRLCLYYLCSIRSSKCISVNISTVSDDVILQSRDVGEGCITKEHMAI